MNRRSFFRLAAILPFAVKKVVAILAAAPVPPMSPILPAGYFPLSQFKNTGYVYAPYIPLFTTPDVMLPPVASADTIRFARAYARSQINQDHYLKEFIGPS